MSPRDRLVRMSFALATVCVPDMPEPETVSVRIWQDPRPVAQRDLRWGSGSPDRAPRPPFTFVEENTTGSQPKVVVTDSTGARWDVKFGPEAHAEVAAGRIVWALGYFVDETYFVPEGIIKGAADLSRAKEVIGPDGRFDSARFERRDPNRRIADRNWSFDANPFLNSRELSGLKILMTMVGNWDIEGERNNRVVEVGPSGKPERHFMISDLGATFGRMGNRLTSHSKWVLADYQAEGFIDAVRDDVLELDYDGLQPNMDRVPLEHARWFAALAGELTAEQIRQAFGAAGATPEELEGFSAAFAARVAALQRAVAQSSAGASARRRGRERLSLLHAPVAQLDRAPAF